MLYYYLYYYEYYYIVSPRRVLCILEITFCVVIQWILLLSFLFIFVLFSSDDITFLDILHLFKAFLLKDFFLLFSLSQTLFQCPNMANTLECLPKTTQSRDAPRDTSRGTYSSACYYLEMTSSIF